MFFNHYSIILVLASFLHPLQEGVWLDPTISNSSPTLVLQSYIFSAPHSFFFSRFSCYLLVLVQVKNRWAGKTIVDFFSQEFKGRPFEYYVRVPTQLAFEYR